jgi:hypothetical protein
VEEVFVVKFFSQEDEGKIKTNIYLRMFKNISLGMPQASLYANTNLGLQTFKLLFFEHYEKFI